MSIDRSFVEPGEDFELDVCYCRRLVNAVFDIIEETTAADENSFEQQNRALAMLDSVRIRLREMDDKYTERFKEEHDPSKDVVITFKDKVKISEMVDALSKERGKLEAHIDSYLEHVWEPLHKYGLYLCEDEREEG